MPILSRPGGQPEGGFNAALGMAGSYYAATSNPTLSAPPLLGDVRADVCIIGGGCTGLSAALHAAEAGLSVVLLEGGRLGWGASGRNGGQIIPGLRLGALELTARYGEEEARALFDLSIEARHLVVDLIARHGILCDLKLTGHLSAAAKPRDLETFKREAECLVERMNYPHVRLVGANDISEEVSSSVYHGGLIDNLGGHYHPLNYTLGLAGAAARAGAALHQGSAALRLERGSALRVVTEGGHVSADRVILAGDALLGGLDPGLEHYIMPVANYVIATAPLERPDELIAADRAVSDSRFVVNYFRMTADHRLLFGGGERYSVTPPTNIGAFVAAHMRRIFPQAKDLKVDFAWGGLVSITRTRLPHLGGCGGVLFAHGYSGLGAVLSTLAGKVMAEALIGKTDPFERFARVAPPGFPGGVTFRGPLHTFGMLWYALRDRL